MYMQSKSTVMMRSALPLGMETLVCEVRPKHVPCLVSHMHAREDHNLCPHPSRASFACAGTGWSERQRAKGRVR
jgi:hypothetical protein